MKYRTSTSKWIFLFLLITFVTGFNLQANEQTIADSTYLADSTNPEEAIEWIRVIVELNEPPVVQLAGLPRNDKGKIEVNNPAATIYRTILENSHLLLRENLSAILPEAQIVWDYYTVFNGVSIRLPKNSLDILSNLQNIKTIHHDKSFELNMDVGSDLVGATALYPALGGVGNAGNGVKVAVVDTGIYMNHDFFDPTTFSMPSRASLYLV